VSDEIARLRIEYPNIPLREGDVPPNPIALFRLWFQDAVAAALHEPNAMSLATAGVDGRPSARIVLLKEFDERGFTFFTHYTSRKGRDLAANPYAALVFYWGPLHRQVRVEGRVEQAPPEESDAYYQARPKNARLGAWVSAQSSVIPNRAALDEGLAAMQQKYATSDPPRPPHWGGYRLAPDTIEFWQGGEHRLHDRLRYTQEANDRWLIERLAP